MPTWQASFISSSVPSEADDPAVYFHREFDAAPDPMRATLFVSALGVVEPYLNGARVGDEVLAPGWTSYRHRLHVSRYDVTELVSPGANALGATVGEGWAVGALTWDNIRNNYADRPALFLQLELEYPDRTEVIGTDESFSIGTGAVRGSGIYAGETYDARLEPAGWSSAGFDSSEWDAAHLFEWDLATLIETSAEPIRRIDELAPVSITATDHGTSIVDFGQVLSGWVRLSVEGEAGTTVTLRHAEVLKPNGEIERETNRTAEATDRYTLAGGGVETWEPGFTFHGFRYVEVDGWQGELTSDSLRAIVVHSDMTRTGWFTTSDPLVSQLHENTLWSMRGNFVGVPTDCPQRDERLGWTGDLNAFATTATYLYDVRGVLRSWLQDLAVEQRESGSVPMVVPDVLSAASGGGGTMGPTALWGDVAVSLPWELYQEYGDLQILRDCYESMTAFIRQVEALLDGNGLWSAGFQLGDWLDPDAPADNPAGGKTDRHLVASAYLCKTTRELARTSELLGETADAEHFTALHERVRQAFRAEFVTAAGRVVNESATAYALAIMFDILDESQKDKAGQRLAEIVEASGYTIATGFAGTPLVTDALSGTGHIDAAYKLLLQTKSPSFLYPVTMGATTIWERWDAVLPDGSLNSTGMTSLNHYALGAVASWLHRVVGGLARAEAGWTKLMIAPKPGGMLMSASTAHDTVLGRASVDWRVEDGELLLDVVVPEGATATVVLPLHPDALVEEVGSGAHSWRYPAPDGYGQKVEFGLDTLFKDVMSDDVVWPAVIEVLKRHLPGMPIEAAGAHLSEAPVRHIVAQLPGGGEQIEEELLAALSARPAGSQPSKAAVA